MRVRRERQQQQQQQRQSQDVTGPARAVRHFRRTAAVGLVAVAATAGVAAIGAPAAQGAPGQEAEPFNKGVGSAIAQSVRLDPVAGGLSFGVGVGEALASHQNTGAIAESRAANLGVIGTTLAAEGCDGGDPSLPAEDQPTALRVESGEEGADAGKSGQDSKVPGVDRQVRATTAPYAEALTSGANFDVPGAMSVQGFRTFASSGVETDLRQAIARTEIDRLVVAGVVEFRGMVWEATHRSGSADEQLGTFTFGSMSVGGTPVPFEDPTAGLGQANDVLRPLGFELRAPRIHYDETSNGTLATVDPLGVRAIPSPARDGVVNPILNGVQPVRTELFQALIDADCGNATYITILDIVLNAFGSGGYFAIELGGVQASTAAIQRFSGLGAGGSLPPLVGGLPASGTTGGGTRSGTTGRTGTGTAATPGGAPTAPAAPTGSGGGSPTIDDAVETAADVTGSRGGALAGVGGAGLLLLLATAEGDRRKMRRAMREIPMEA